MTTQLLVLITLLAACCSGCQVANGGQKFEGFGTLTTLFTLPQRQADWPAGELTGSGFEPDADEHDSSPGTRAMLLAESFRNAAALSTQLQPGRRAWVKGEVFNDVIRIDEIEVIPYTRAGEIPAKAATTVGRFEFVEVGAWHNRMPPATDKRHLVLNIRAENTASDRKPRTVRVERIFYSFDKDREGVVAKDMSLIDPATGMAGGKREMPLPPAAPADVNIRGENTYPDGHLDEELYVIVILSVGDERIVLRHHGTIIAAY